jgi:hypothetical protein
LRRVGEAHKGKLLFGNGNSLLHGCLWKGRIWTYNFFHPKVQTGHANHLFFEGDANLLKNTNHREQGGIAFGCSPMVSTKGTVWRTPKHTLTLFFMIENMSKSEWEHKTLL